MTRAAAAQLSDVYTVIAGAPSPGEGPFIVRWLAVLWPNLVVQGEDCSGVVSTHDPSINRLRVFFVYRTHADYEAWWIDGTGADRDDTMIEVVLGKAETTLMHASWGASAPAHPCARLRDAVAAWRNERSKHT